jgi:two-component system, chemotaxis family, response regulator Rcp1
VQIASSPAIIKILAVEDNPADIRLLVEALKDATVANELHIASNGRQALDMLFGLPPEYKGLSPDIVLLDLNLPDLSGHDVLKRIKSHRTLRHIPVVILTTSHEERDIMESYQRYANSYITKPADYDRFIQVVRTIEEFWLSTAILPRGYPA